MDFLADFCSIANAFCEKQVATRGKGGPSYQPPSKLEHLYGCGACAYSEMGCRHCWDNPFATRPTARAKPGKGHYQDHVPAAPTFRPTAEQFKDPFAYLASIAPEAQKAGIALIIPPEGWEPPIQLLDQQTGQLRKDFKVPVRIQPTHLLCRRYPTPSGAPPAQVLGSPMGSKGSGQSSSADTAAVISAQPKKSNAVTGRCSKKGMEQSHAQPKSNAVTGRCSKAGMEQQKAAAAAEQAKILNPAHWDAVAAAAEATDGQFGYEHLEDPLSLYDFHRYADWAKRRHFNGPLMAGSRRNGTADAAAANPSGSLPIQTASSAWRTYPCTPTARAARGVTGKWIPGTATEAEYNYGADWTEPSIAEVEAEFWRIVESPDEQVEALYGQDIDTATYSSAFPTIKELAVAEAKNLMLPEGRKKHNSNTSQQQQRDEDLEDAADPANCFATCKCGSCQLCRLRQYTRHPWNINNLPQAKGSVLRFVREDVGGKPITGLMVPWVYVGSCFSAFCWHIEDHGLYSINYNHMGAPKVWYGVPATAAGGLDAVMRDALPHLFARDKLLLHKLVTMMSPTQLMERGIPCCRAVQVPGSFVVTFPDAYHAGFNSGFNVAEAVNFAAPDWLPFGSSSVVRYRCESRYMTFSHDAMLINVVRDATAAAAAKALPAPPAHIAEQDQDQQQAQPASLLPPVLQPADSQGLKAAFAADLQTLQQQILAAEAAAAEQQFKQKQQQPPEGQRQAGLADISVTGEVRLVGPAAGAASSSSSAARTLAVLLSNSLLDTRAWLDILPDEAWAEAAAVADEAAAYIAAEQQQQQQGGQEGGKQGPANPQQQRQEHHLAAASQQHHGGQRERVFTMRGGPVSQAAAVDASADTGAAPSDSLRLAKTARGLAAAVFTRKKPKITAAAGGSSAAAAGWVDTQGEAAVAAITEYILSLADSRRQQMLIEPPSSELSRLAVGELALRLELESQRQKALMLKAGITRVSLMQGTTAAVSAATGVHINTKGVECATCGCDLSLAAVVSESDPGRAVCPEHYTDLDGTRSDCYLLLRYMPGQLEQLLAKAVQLIPGAREAVQSARARMSWVAAGRFMGSTVLHKPADTAAAAAEVMIKQEPAAVKLEQQQQQQQGVVEVKLLGKLYEPSDLSSRLFEDLGLESCELSDDEGSNESSSLQDNKLDLQNNMLANGQQMDDNSGAENQSSGSWFGDQNINGQDSEDEPMAAGGNDSCNKSISRKRVRVEDGSLGRMGKRVALAVQA